MSGPIDSEKNEAERNEAHGYDCIRFFNIRLTNPLENIINLQTKLQAAWPHVYPAPAEAPISSQLFMLFPLTGRRFVLRRFGIIRNALEYLERGDHPLKGVYVVGRVETVVTLSEVLGLGSDWPVRGSCSGVLPDLR